MPYPPFFELKIGILAVCCVLSVFALFALTGSSTPETRIALYVLGIVPWLVLFVWYAARNSSDNFLQASPARIRTTANSDTKNVAATT